ncbi:MAG: lytic transglycosylase F [marine benthic group bacterium]|nr:lytic transglycosylase F [Gemmatimonadota bacterium]
MIQDERLRLPVDTTFTALGAVLHRILAVALIAVAASTCSDSPNEEVAGAASEEEVAGAASEEQVAGDDLLTSLDEQTRELQFALSPWHGDLDGIIEERFGLIRLLTVFEPMHYAVDGRKQGGITFEAGREFEKYLNERLGITRAADKLHVVIVPVRRDELIPFIRDGRGDIAAANLTITEERLEEVDFSDPFVADAYEIVVTGPDSDSVESLEDLSGRSVFVRRSSSYRESLEKLNRDLDAKGLPPAEIVEVNELLDDGAILELVNDGDIPVTVVDKHIADFWTQVFPNLTLHDSVRPRENAQIAFAVQKGAPELVGHINAFASKHGKGSLLGNVLIKRYYQSPKWLERVNRYDANRRLDSLMGYFQASAARYDLDWRRLAAQGYQESGLDQSRKSSRGALGIMQLMPATAREMGFDDVSTAEANIEAGAKYMRHIIDTYFSEVESNPDVESGWAREQAYALAVAAYNAGPTRISRIRREAADRGLDSKIWFGSVEPLVAREVGLEPVTYVDNIFAYSIRIQLHQRHREQTEELRDSGAVPGQS